MGVMRRTLVGAVIDRVDKPSAYNWFVHWGCAL
jgi:hypothetical protein